MARKKSTNTDGEKKQVKRGRKPKEQEQVADTAHPREEPEEKPQTAQEEVVEAETIQETSPPSEPEITAENKPQEESVVQEPHPEPVVEKVPQETPAQKKRNPLSEHLYDVSEKETAEMMRFIGISMFPEHQDSDIWMTAVAKVQKRDMSMSWCVLKRERYDKHKITKIFGNCSPIHLVGRPIPLETVPYEVAARVMSRGRNYIIQTIHSSLKTPFETLNILDDEKLHAKLIDTIINEYWQEYERNEEKKRKAAARAEWLERQQ